MRMWQLVHGDGGARGPGFVEELAVDLVVAAEVVHVHQIRGQRYDVREVRAGLAEDVADVLDDRAGLRPDVQRGSAHGVHFCAGDRVVRAPATGAGHEREPATHLNMRGTAAPCRLAVDV